MDNKRACKCEDWRKYVKEIDAAFQIQAMHDMGGYKGKKFVYCPWCGERLPEIQKEAPNGS